MPIYNEVEITTVKHAPGGGYLLNGAHSVPVAPGNRDYEAILAWLADGNTPDPAFTQAELDQQAADAAFDLEEEEDRTNVKGNAVVRALVTKRPAVIDTWIDNNVNNMAEAKDVLKILAKVVAVLVKREFRQ